MNFEIKKLNLKFYSFSNEVLKNGDTRYFGFISHNAVRTYSYLSLKQINALKKDFTLTDHSDAFANEKTTYYTKSKAIEKNFYFNIGLIYLIEKESADTAKRHINQIKKTPLLEFILSDQPEIFYDIKPKVYSYKKIYKLRFGDFFFGKEYQSPQRQQDSLCYQMKDLESSKEISEFLLGQATPKSKKTLMTHLFNNDYGDINFNYRLFRIILFLKNIFSNEEICYLLDHKYDALVKSFLFKDILYAPLRSDDTIKGIILYINEFKTFQEKTSRLLTFNIPHHILWEFSEVLEKALPVFKPDLSKSSDALYTFNNLSRDLGRRMLKNFPLAMVKNKNFANEIAALDGLKINEWSFEVPKDYHTLIDWGSHLANCSGNFHAKKTYEDYLLVGIKKKGVLKYLVSLKGENYREVKQFLGFKNAIPTKEELDLLFAPFAPFLTKPKENLVSLKKYKGNAEDSLI